MARRESRKSCSLPVLGRIACRSCSPPGTVPGWHSRTIRCCTGPSCNSRPMGRRFRCGTRGIRRYRRTKCRQARGRVRVRTECRRSSPRRTPTLASDHSAHRSGLSRPHRRTRRCSSRLEPERPGPYPAQRIRCRRCHPCRSAIDTHRRGQGSPPGRRTRAASSHRSRPFQRLHQFRKTRSSPRLLPRRRWIRPFRRLPMSSRLRRPPRHHCRHRHSLQRCHQPHLYPPWYRPGPKSTPAR